VSKFYILIIVLFPLFSIAQSGYIKTKEMGPGFGTYEEWQWVDNIDSVNKAKKPKVIHDTIYIYRDSSPLKKKTDSIVFSETGSLFRIGDWRFDEDKYSYHNKRKKRKKQKNESSWNIPCHEDTVKGYIYYCSSDIEDISMFGCTQVEGYWIGCGSERFWVKNLMILPGRFKKSYIDEQGKIKVKGYYSGVFCTLDYKIIPSWRVHFLYTIE